MVQPVRLRAADGEGPVEGREGGRDVVGRLAGCDALLDEGAARRSVLVWWRRAEEGGRRGKEGNGPHCAVRVLASHDCGEKIQVGGEGRVEDGEGSHLSESSINLLRLRSATRTIQGWIIIHVHVLLLRDFLQLRYVTDKTSFLDLHPHSVPALASASTLRGEIFVLCYRAT